ncbi:2'-5' RNA ligase family protein [Ectobacillus ponti]|uniref:2'-5' RNA ligase family protein n=1 Tax=Ectobacillus ponti TaxID=2961894 RepID=A0AA41X7X6_9BACI|nr:2'-5' RNA ligase family protein [Ectobacillus ponti]MCP8967928.1 2'-5' RNA ligase family protein [Ectobacillus ponti]
MQFFIGIVPHAEQEERIISFMRQYHPDYSLPHITVKAQGGLAPERDWLERVEAVCRAFPAFRVALGAPQYFGNRVLYLGVDAPEIHNLHRQLVAAVNPPEELIGKYFEREQYVPHLTLAQAKHGVDLREIGCRAAEELQPYPAFQAEFVRVYCQEREGAAYLLLCDIPLQV